MLVKPYMPDKIWSADEYLAWESEQEFKNELIDNRVWIMCGANQRHNVISLNLMVALHPLAEERGYTLLWSRMCLKVDPDSTYAYPDMSIVRGEPKMSCRLNQHTFEDPVVIFEILSQSTEKMDRTRKKDLYLQLESLDAYILVSEEKPRVEMFRRQGDTWLYYECAGLDASLVIPALDCEIPLSEAYRQVRFEDS